MIQTPNGVTSMICCEVEIGFKTKAAYIDCLNIYLRNQPRIPVLAALLFPSSYFCNTCSSSSAG